MIFIEKRQIYEISGNGLILLKMLENPAIEPNAMNSTGSTAFHYFCAHHSQPSGIRRVRFFRIFAAAKLF